MTNIEKDKFVNMFVVLLLKHEESLSDGFKYYSNDSSEESAIEKINEIAEEFYNKINFEFRYRSLA